MQKITYIKHKKLFFIFLLIAPITALALFMAIKKLALFTHSANFFSPSNVTYEIHNSRNTKMQLAMIDFITKQTSQNNLLNFDKHLFYKELKSLFPQIDNLEWKILSSKTLHMTIDLIQPEILINNQYVLGYENKLLTVDLFDSSELEGLPFIYIHDSLIQNNEKLDQKVFDFVQSIPENMFESFDIEYYSASKVVLRPALFLGQASDYANASTDKQDDRASFSAHPDEAKRIISKSMSTKTYNYQIITNAHSLPSQKKLDYIQTIFKDLKQKNIITNWRLKNQRGPFVFDMRIKNQIIVKLPEPFKTGRAT